jgi:hypothetical protein
MERASILPLSTVNKDDHLFGIDHVWKEVLGVSWQWPKWLHRLLYIDFIIWWFLLDYFTDIYGLISAVLMWFLWMNRRGEEDPNSHIIRRRGVRKQSVTTKLNARHVEGIGVRIWFGVLVCKGNSTTSISIEGNLTSVKHIYVYVNVDAIVMWPRFVQQEWGVRI